METVAAPYSVANGCTGELHAASFPHHHPGMGPALTPTGPPSSHPPPPSSSSSLPNGAGSTTSSTTTNPGSAGPGSVGHSCCGCGRVIQDRFLLFALNHYWHTGCLKCTCCQAQLGEIGKSCFERNNMILCRNDYIRLFGTEGSCSACHQKIPPSELVFRVPHTSVVYHLKCFVCVTCRQPLQPGDRYSLLNGNLVCEQDHPKVTKGQSQGQGHVPLPTRTSHKVC